MGLAECVRQRVHQVMAKALTVLAFALLTVSFPAYGTVLWSHPGIVLVRDNDKGQDILHGAIKPQDSNSTSTLYFRFRVDPVADSASKSIADFEAGFVLVEKGEEHLGIGSTRVAWAYCAWPVSKTEKGFEDLNSAKPEPPYRWEYIRASEPRYIALKIQYVPGNDAHITAWLSPDLSLGATEINQPTNIVTRFEANATFDEIHLIFRGGNGTGWKFSQMVAGTTFEDLLLPHFWQQRWFFAASIVGLLVIVASTVLLLERRRARVQFQRLEKERAVAAERARIAQDIHDEVGTSLTKISKLSEMMDLHEESGGANADPRQTIATTARDTIRAMDEIVWAINLKNDTLKEMADYLVYFTKDFLGPTGIACSLEVPLNLPDIPVTAEARHNLLMAVKEALNNAVRHAAPRQIRLGLELTENRITVLVADDGRGFCVDEASGVGNGLENMQKRLSAIGGKFQLQSEVGHGTTVRLQVPLRQSKKATR
jgi:signal transduction histidine kinase